MKIKLEMQEENVVSTSKNKQHVKHNFMSRKCYGSI